MRFDASSSTRSILLARLRSGDEAAFRDLVEWLGPQALRWCRRAGLSAADADEIAQEAFLAIFRNLPQFERRPETGGFRAWVWTIVRRKALDRLRQRNPVSIGDAIESFLSEEPPEPDDRDRDDLLQGVCRTVRAQFTTTSWEAFRLTAMEGLSAADAGRKLGMTAQAVRKAKSRVLAAFRTEMAAWEGSEER